MVIADLPRCQAASLEQKPRKRSQHGLTLRRYHTLKSHVVENEVELERGPGPVMRPRRKLRSLCELYQKSHREPPA